MISEVSAMVLLSWQIGIGDPNQESGPSGNAVTSQHVEVLSEERGFMSSQLYINIYIDIYYTYMVEFFVILH